MSDKRSNDKVQRRSSSGLMSSSSDVKSTTSQQKDTGDDYDIEEDRKVENKPLGEKSKTQLQLAPPGPRRPGTDQPTSEGLARKGGAASSISSWEERLPEPDEESETWTAQSEPPLSQPGAHRMPGINGADHDDEMTVDNADLVSPSGDSLVYAEAIKTPEIVEGQEFQDRPPGEFCSMSLRTRAFVIGFPLLVIVGLGIGLVLGLGNDPSAVTSSPEISQIPGNWTQIGIGLVGEGNDGYFGVSIALSGDGSVLTVGAPGNENNGNHSGSVYAYRQNFDGTDWIRLGGDLHGATEFDVFGRSVSLSEDGSILAVGASQFVDDDFHGTGYVLVFQLVDDTWAPIGNPIIGRSEGDAFGFSMALSADGKTLAVVAYGGSYTAVYNLQNENWNQVGSDIPGQAWSVSLSHDGTVLAIGDALDLEQVQVYHLADNQQWKLVGDALGGGETLKYDFFGMSVSPSADGRFVVVGAPLNGGNDSRERGAAYVYQNIDDNWKQVGSDLIGTNPGDWFGLSVSLSDDGTVLTVGAGYNDSNSDNSGQVRVFLLVNNEWSPIGDPINGRSVHGYFGTSVALSADGKIVAGGGAAGGAQDYVMVYRLEEQ